ncbi:MAG: hypothetical protein IPM42_04980 [Saprospiraceae bacterium]|nr:hypothetical protein [Saprospiraceae bacterium]
MKKFNFLPVLMIALFMFLGFDGNAQYYPVEKSLGIIESVLQTTPITASTAPSTVAERLNVTKVKVGQKLILAIKESNNVSSALNQVFGAMNTGGIPGRIQKKSEVESFYRNLLTLEN